MTTASAERREGGVHIARASRRVLPGFLALSVAGHALLFALFPAGLQDTEPPPGPLQVTVAPPEPLPMAPPEPPLAAAQDTPASKKPARKPEARQRGVRPTPAPAPVPPQAWREPPTAVPAPVPPAAESKGSTGAAQPEAPAVASGAESVPQPAQPAVTPPAFKAPHLHNSAPRYPLAARRAGEQGTTTVRVLVSADGRPLRVDLEKSSGSTSLDQAALAALRSWRFVPARRGSEPVEGWVVVPIVFRLEG